MGARSPGVAKAGTPSAGAGIVAVLVGGELARLHDSNADTTAISAQVLGVTRPTLPRGPDPPARVAPKTAR
jgi:3-hydroxy-3-methylglutaryl CoA synthase